LPLDIIVFSRQPLSADEKEPAKKSATRMLDNQQFGLIDVELDTCIP